MADLSQIRVSGTLYDIKDAVARQATGAPAVAATVSDMTDRNKVYVYTGSESGYTSGNWYYFNGSSWVSGGVYNSAAVETDTSLSVSGAPADAKVTGDSIKYIVSVGDTPPSNYTQLLLSETVTEVNLVTEETFSEEINGLKSQVAQLSSIPAEVKRAFDSLFRHMLLNSYDGSAEYAIIHSWANTNPVISISAVFDPEENAVYDTDDIDDLKQYLTVIATYANSTSAEVDTYTLSGTMAEGTQTFTVTYDDVSTSFTADIAYDSTAKIATRGYYMYHVANADNTSESSYGLQASTNAGITVKYNLATPKQVGDYYSWCGILPTGAYSSKDFYKATGKVASLMTYDAQDNHLSFMNELGTSSFTRWLQSASGTTSEFVYESSAGLTYGFDKVEWMVDVRYLDDSYIYEGVSGQVIFAGKNTPYFGMHNISEAE